MEKHVDNVDNSVYNSFFQKLTGNCVWITHCKSKCGKVWIMWTTQESNIIFVQCDKLTVKKNIMSS